MNEHEQEIKIRVDRINYLHRNVSSLNIQKRQYRVMSQQINEAIGYLSNASKGVDTAKNNLKKNYSSTNANKKYNELKTQKSEIDKMLGILRDKILVEANHKYDNIETQVQEKNREIRKLEWEVRQLQSL